MSGNLYVVTNQSGAIVAVSPSFQQGQTRGGILPIAGQKLFRLDSVDAKILSLANPDEFHEALTRQFISSETTCVIENPEAHVLELLQENFRFSTAAKAK